MVDLSGAAFASDALGATPPDPADFPDGATVSISGCDLINPVGKGFFCSRKLNERFRIVTTVQRLTLSTDNQPPDCSSAAPSAASLWPPNHKFVPINVNGVTDPDGDEVTITIDSIMQDEPVNGKGDGNTSPDGKGVGSDTAEVRAERSGKGDGRVYHVSYNAADGNGGTCSGEVLVEVPHDKKDTAVDSGPQLFDSTTP